MIKAKFPKGFQTEKGKKREVYCGVSLDNPNMKSHNIKALFELIDKHKSRVKELKMVVGDRMLAFYLGNEVAKKIAKKWLEEAETEVKKYSFPCKFISWYELEKTKEYQTNLLLAKKEYEKDQQFKRIVDTVAKQKTNKKNCKFETAKDFLLNDVAGYLCFKDSTIYPSMELNRAINYQLVKQNKKLDYFYYTFSKKGNSKNNKVLLLKLIESHQEQKKQQEETIKILIEMRNQIKLLNKKINELEKEKQEIKDKVNSGEVKNFFTP